MSDEAQPIQQSVAVSIAEATKLRTQVEQKIASLEQPVFQEAHALLHSQPVEELLTALQGHVNTLSVSSGQTQLKHLASMIQSTRTILSSELTRLHTTLNA